MNTVPSVEACRPALAVDERRNPQDAVGNGSDDEQSAGPLAEIAPLSSGHDILCIDDTGSRSRLCLIFATAASSSRSHVPVETCGRHSTPNLGANRPECPPVSTAVDGDCHSLRHSALARPCREQLLKRTSRQRASARKVLVTGPVGVPMSDRSPSLGTAVSGVMGMISPQRRPLFV